MQLIEKERRAFARRYVSMHARVKPGHDEEKRPDPAFAAHHFVLRRARDTKSARTPRETNHIRKQQLMGIASLHPSYTLLPTTQKRAGSPPAAFCSMDARVKPGHDEWDQLSRKLRSFLDRDGCFNFRSAFASIWRMRSLVTENC